MLRVTFRLANYETPLWALANFSEGRYNRAGTGPTQYLSLHPMTPWAELLRNEDRRTRERATMMRYPLWAIKVDLATEPVTLDFETAGSYGLAPDDLVADDRTPCQAFGEGLRDDDGGPRALIAPSAALPGTKNLVIFDPAVVTAYEAAPVGSEDFPTAMVSQDGRCPEGLWDQVHYAGAGTPHPEHEAWLNGGEYAFEEPEVMAALLSA